MKAPTMRVAFATNALDAVARMYALGLGLAELASFEDHSGYDGVILGHSGWPYHLEFTRRRGVEAVLARDEDNLLVFYFPDAGEWDKASARMLAAGFKPVAPANPYWALHGRTFQDLEGRVVVLQEGAW